MKKIFTLFILLMLLPVTALAVDAPGTLYVGDKSLSVANDSYWTTDANGKLTTCNATENWNVKYEYSTVTLTLKNATIIGVPDNVNTVGAGIYAASSSDPVSLNIVLEGENKVSGEKIRDFAYLRLIKKSAWRRSMLFLWRLISQMKKVSRVPPKQ